LCSRTESSTLAFRRNRARVRDALWFCASVKFLVPLSLMLWLGSVIGSGIASIVGPSMDSIIGSSALSVFGTSGTSDPFGAAGLLGSSGSWRALTWLAATGTAALWPSTFTISEVAAAWFSLALLGIWTCGFFAIVASRIRLSRQLWDVALTSRRVELLDPAIRGPASKHPR
jgi:hypothetical protein